MRHQIVIQIKRAFSKIAWGYLLLMASTVISSEQAVQIMRYGSPEQRGNLLQQYLVSTNQLSGALIEAIIGNLEDRSEVMVRHPGEAPSFYTVSDRARAVLIKQAEHALPYLRAGLHEEPESVRWRIPQILGYLKSDLALPTLYHLLEHDESRLVRRATSEALSKVLEEPSTELFDLLNTGSKGVQEEVVWLLGEIGTNKEKALLLDIALYGEDALASLAAEALQKMGADVSKELGQALVNAPNEALRIKAINTLQRFTYPEAQEDLLLFLLTSSEEKARLAALDALASYNNPLHVDAFLNACFDLNTDVANEARKRIARTGPQGAEALAQYLTNPNPTLQYIAARGLTLFGRLANSYFQDMLMDVELDTKIRRLAANHLRHYQFELLDETEIVTALLLLEEVHALGFRRLNNVEKLNVVLVRDVAEVRRAALVALRQDMLAIQAQDITPFLTDEDESIRLLAQTILKEMGARAMPPLERLLKPEMDPYNKPVAEVLDSLGYAPRNVVDQVRFFVALEEWDALATLGRAALDYVIEELENSDPNTTIWAAWAIYNLHEKQGLGRNIPSSLRFLLRPLDAQTGKAIEDALTGLSLDNSYVGVARRLPSLFTQEDQVWKPTVASFNNLRSSAIELLAAGLESENIRIVDRCLAALEAVGRPAIEALRDAMVQESVAPKVASILSRLNYAPGNDRRRIQYQLALGDYSSLVKAGSTGTREVLDVVRKGAPKEKIAAIEALQFSEDPVIIDFLLTQYAESDTPEIKEAIKQTIIEIGPKTIQYLKQVAFSEHITLSQLAATFLEQLDYQPVDPNEALYLDIFRQDFASLLKEKKEVNALLRTDLLTNHHRRRALATGVLAAMREFEFYTLQKNLSEVEADLETKLRSSNAEDLAAAAEYIRLSREKPVQTIPLLMNLLGDDRYVQVPRERQFKTQYGTPNVGRFAALALGSMISNSVNRLRPFLQINDQITRSNVLVAVIHDPDPTMVTNLLETLEWDASYVTLLSMRQLVALNYTPGIRAMVNRGLRGNLEIKQAAGRAVGELLNQNPRLLPALLKEDASATEKEFIVRQALEHATDAVLPAMIEYAQTLEPDEQGDLMLSLSNVDAPLITEYMVQSLTNTYWVVNNPAKKYLIRVGEGAIQPIIDTMKRLPFQQQVVYIEVLKSITGRDEPNWERWWHEQQGLKE